MFDFAKWGTILGDPKVFRRMRRKGVSKGRRRDDVVQNVSKVVDAKMALVEEDARSLEERFLQKAIEVMRRHAYCGGDHGASKVAPGCASRCQNNRIVVPRCVFRAQMVDLSSEMIASQDWARRQMTPSNFQTLRQPKRS